MSEADFWNIAGILHLADNEQPGAITEKLHKVLAFQQMMELKWVQNYKYPQNLALDEAIIPYSGRLSFLQFIHNKPTRWGIKAFLLSSSATGYTYKMKIYSGKEGEGLSTRELVEEMVAPLENQAYILYLDNFYTSVELLKSLRRKKIRCSGTLRKNRIKNTDLVASFKKFSKGEMKFYTDESEQELTLLLWKDKKDVVFLSNHRGDEIDEVRKTRKVKGKEVEEVKQVPAIRTHYNQKARGVDLSNQLCQTFR